MFIVLTVWSADEITLAEAIITFLFFFLLIGLAFAADKINERKKKRKIRREEEAQMQEDSMSGVIGTIGIESRSKGSKDSVLSLVKFNELLEAERKGKIRGGAHGADLSAG